MVATETIETRKCDEALQMLKDQREACCAHITQRKRDLEAEWDRWILAGEEESSIAIMMDMTDMDYTIVTEHG